VFLAESLGNKFRVKKGIKNSWETMLSGLPFTVKVLTKGGPKISEKRNLA